MAEGERRKGDEMRPVTALFADVVGSTRLGERLPPDEVKVLIGECVSRMSRAVEGFGGVVQAYLGDGICAYFGVPSAHEDDPERAARAGLQILGIVDEYEAEIERAWGIPEFSVRVGINSGPTAVGEVGAAERGTVALGDTTNVAARLQAAAEPRTIAVGEGTARFLSERFVLEPLGPVAVKGRAQPVEAWRLVGPRPTAEPRPATTLVGRGRELSQVDEAVRDLVAGRGQALLLVGEAGLGKTRMLGELRRLVGERATWLEGRCHSYGGQVPYGPFAEVLRTWLGAGEGEPEVATRTKLRARMAALDPSRAEELLPFLALVLPVRLDPEREREMLSLSAEELSSGILNAYAEWLESLAHSRPLVLAIDDFHWAGPTSRAMAERILALTDRAAVLLAAAFRPDPASEAWRFRLDALAEFAHRTLELPLPPLSHEASEELVRALAPAGLLPPELQVEIVVRAEGNPLFLEELLRMVLASAGDRHRTWTVSAGAAADLPPALEALLVARIDRLPEGARSLAQVAAAVGREFPVRVLERIAGTQTASEGLAVLLRSEIVRETRRYPELVCSFRHGLLQDAALSTLTPPVLRELYGAVGAAFEELYPEAVEGDPERLAFYLYRSDEQQRAMPYLERAAERAADPSHAAELWTRAHKVAVRFSDAQAEHRIEQRLAGLGSGG